MRSPARARKAPAGQQEADGVGEQVVLAALASLYGFLYLLLRLEDYALLSGSIGLFIVLAVVMFVTRRMNWYEMTLGERA